MTGLVSIESDPIAHLGQGIAGYIKSTGILPKDRGLVYDPDRDTFFDRDTNTFYDQNKGAFVDDRGNMVFAFAKQEREDTPAQPQTAAQIAQQAGPQAPQTTDDERARMRAELIQPSERGLFGEPTPTDEELLARNKFFGGRVFFHRTPESLLADNDNVPGATTSTGADFEAWAEAEFAKMDAFDRKFDAAGGRVVTDADGNTYTTREYQEHIKARIADGTATADEIATLRAVRAENAELVIQRHFIGKSQPDQEKLARDAIARGLTPGIDLIPGLGADGFDPVASGRRLQAPSANVEEKFRAFSQTNLGADALEQILANDDLAIANRWMKSDGTITELGIRAYGRGEWRPFRVANSQGAPASVTASGVLMLPDKFPLRDEYPTGGIVHPSAVLYHEIKAHVLPQKASDAIGNWASELRGIAFENEMLRELGLPERPPLYWGGQAGLGDETIYGPTMMRYKGTVRFDKNGNLIQVNPKTLAPVGPAIPLGVAPR